MSTQNKASLCSAVAYSQESVKSAAFKKDINQKKEVKIGTGTCKLHQYIKYVFINKK